MQAIPSNRPATAFADGDRTYTLGFVALALTLAVYRYWASAHLGLTLYIDEAYYWLWSQDLQWGYFSKPPVIAAIIAATTSLCGDGTSCVRLGSILLHPITGLLIYALGRQLFGARVGFWSGLYYLTMPAVSVSSLVISTDVALMLFWAATLFSFQRAVERHSSAWWMTAGVLLGLGLLSKYTMLLFGLSALLYLLSSPEYRSWWRDWRPWAATVVGLLVFAPNLWWNLDNGFPTLVHTAEISKLDREGLSWGELGAFFGSQFGVFGPLGFALLLYLMARPGQWWGDRRFRLLVLFALPFLLVICLQALLGRAHANWAAPAYVSASVLVVAWLLERQRRRLLATALGVNLALGLAIYHFYDITDGLGLHPPAKADPFLRLQGWREFGDQLAQAMQQSDAEVIVSDSRTVLSHAAYELQLPTRVAAWNPRGAVRHQFDLDQDINRHKARHYLFVSEHGWTENAFVPYFEEVQALDDLVISVARDYERRFRLYRLSGFKGY